MGRHFNFIVLPRCGSVIVDLALKFSSTVRESEVLSTLRDAVKNGSFGDFNVSAIRGTRDLVLPTTMTTTPTSPSKSKQAIDYFDILWVDWRREPFSVNYGLTSQMSRIPSVECVLSWY